MIERTHENVRKKKIRTADDCKEDLQKGLTAVLWVRNSGTEIQPGKIGLRPDTDETSKAAADYAACSEVGRSSVAF